MRFECMCVACHGPLILRQRNLTAATCSGNCHKMAYQIQRTGVVPPRYQNLRAHHAYRRELEVTLRWVEARVIQRRVFA